MNVLVTGATGFVGSNLVRTLVSKEHEVHIILRETSDKWRIKGVIEKVNLHHCDLKNKEKVRKVISEIAPQMVFHLAVYGGLPHQQDQFQIIETNLSSTVNLLDACTRTGFDCFINTGSSSEYGIKPSRMKETDVLEPTSDYGVTKAASTLYCQSVARRNSMAIFTLRLFSPYGYFEEVSRLIPTIILCCLKNKEVDLSSPNAVRDFVFIEDVMDAYLKVAERADRINPGEIFNVGSGKQHTVKEVFDVVKRLTRYGKEPRWGSSSGRVGDMAKMWEADVDKIGKAVGWTPKTTLSDGVSKTIEWFKGYYGNQHQLRE